MRFSELSRADFRRNLEALTNTTIYTIAFGVDEESLESAGLSYFDIHTRGVDPLVQLIALGTCPCFHVAPHTSLKLVVTPMSHFFSQLTIGLLLFLFDNWAYLFFRYRW